MGFMGRVKKTICKEGFTYRNTAHELKNVIGFSWEAICISWVLDPRPTHQHNGTGQQDSEGVYLTYCNLK